MNFMGIYFSGTFLATGLHLDRAERDVIMPGYEMSCPYPDTPFRILTTEACQERAGLRGS
jgi:hypothetical protein